MGANAYLTERERGILESAKVGIAGAGGLGSNVAMLLHALLPMGKPVVSAIGLAGWGRSNDIRVRKVGRNLILVGDQTRDVRDGFAPVGVRVTIAAAMQANSIVSLLLGEEP